MLLIGVGLNLLQIAEPISQIPPIATTLGTFESPLRLPPWLNLALGFGAAAGAVERGMRMRHHWLLDGGAGTWFSSRSRDLVAWSRPPVVT